VKCEPVIDYYTVVVVLVLVLVDVDVPKNGVDHDGISWYGEGYEEETPGSRNIGGSAGHFGAAS